MIPTLALLGPLFATEARAADVFDGDLLEIVSPGMLHGDGELVTVRVLALGQDGEPLTGLSLRASASEGKAEGWTSAGGGWYTFRYVPPKTERAIDVALTVKGKGPSGSMEATLDVPVVPSGTGKVSVSVDPRRLVLGETEMATVTFTLDGLVEADLSATVSSGSLSELKSEGGGVYSATFSAPAVNYPHLALLTVTAGDLAGVVGQAAIELQGAVDFPITGAAGSDVSLVIGGTTYGPTTMDGNGDGAIPIIVSPGSNEATKLEAAGGKTTREAFDLQLPATRRLGWFPAPALPADGGKHILHLSVRKPAGSADTGASPEVTASVGSVGSVRHLRDGIYAVTYVPPERDSAATVKLDAQLGSTEQDKASLSVELMPAMPSSKGATPATSRGPVAGVVAVASENRVDPGDTVGVRIAAVDRFGYPVKGVPVKLTVTGGSAVGATTTGPDGTATVTVTAGDAGMLRVSASAGERRTETSVLVAEGIEVVWPRSAGFQGAWEGLGASSTASVVPSPRPDVVAVAPVVPKPEPGRVIKPPSDHEIPWMRLRAGVAGGSYTYAQRPSNNPGPLLPAKLIVGGPEGGRAAPLVGVDFDLRTWFMPYLGAHVGFRTMTYSISAESFDQAPVDWLVRFQGDVNGRYPIDIGSNQVWVGLNVGFQIDDFMVFRGCLDPGCRVEFEPLTVAALDVGGEVGAELGPVFLIGGVTQGLAYGTVPYRIGLDLDAGFEFGGSLFLDVGGSYVNRGIPLISVETDTEIGRIDDRQLVGRASIGFQL